MKRRIIAASTDGESKLAATLDSLKDDFDFILSGLERLERQGAAPANQALILAEGLSKDLNDVISQLGDNLSE